MLSNKETKKQRYKDGSISPGWTVLDQPIPIGASTKHDLNLDSETLREHKEETETPCCSAMYVASQPDDSGDVMGQIANEFQQAARGRNSATGNATHTHDKMSPDDEVVSDQVEAIERDKQTMLVEETGVWTGDEKETEITGDISVSRTDPSASNIFDATETNSMENTKTFDSDYTCTSNDTVMTKTNTTTNKAAEQANKSTGKVEKRKRKENSHPRITSVAGQDTKVGAPNANQTTIDDVTGASNDVVESAIVIGDTNDIYSDNQASTSSQVNESNRSTTSSRRERQPPNNQRWDFSLNGSQSARRSQTDAAIPDSNGIQHKALLEIMGLGLGNFTNDVATIVIDKLRPEYDVIAKRVGQAVKEETTVELTELRQKVDAAEKVLNLLEHEKNKLHEELTKEKGQMRKEIEKEKLQRMKENEEKDATIDQLEKELKKAQMLNREKDRLSRRAESKAKTEEHKRVRVEEMCEAKMKELQKEISKLKSEILVQKSKNRVQSANTRDMVKSGSLARKLKSYHEHAKGKWPTVHPKGVPYDEGDP